jgi:hypothetical protein
MSLSFISYLCVHAAHNQEAKRKSFSSLQLFAQLHAKEGEIEDVLKGGAASAAYWQRIAAGNATQTLSKAVQEA